MTSFKRHIMKPSELWPTSLDNLVKEVVESGSITNYFDVRSKDAEGAPDKIPSLVEAELTVLRNRIEPYGLQAEVKLERTVQYGDRADAWFTVSVPKRRPDPVQIGLIMVEHMKSGGPVAAVRPLLEYMREVEPETWAEFRAMVMNPGSWKEALAEAQAEGRAFIEEQIPRLADAIKAYFSEQAGSSTLPPPDDVPQAIQDFLKRLNLRRPLDGESPTTE